MFGSLRLIVHDDGMLELDGRWHSNLQEIARQLDRFYPGFSVEVVHAGIWDEPRGRFNLHEAARGAVDLDAMLNAPRRRTKAG
jgi:hypothetical protein